MTEPTDQAWDSGLLPSRRALARGAVALAAITLAARAAPAAPTAFHADLEHGPLPFPMVGGSAQAEGSEIAVANRILTAAPRTSPLAMMLYFERLRARNKDGEAYNAGWQKDRWNPIIVTFFEATATTPSGDTTSWCAASLNWMLRRAGYSGGTGSASSGSFREAPGLTRRPRPGDIVVFRDTDSEASAKGLGHVCLFLRQTGNRILVLGGNQVDPRGHHAIRRKWLDKANDSLTLHSFHDMRAFV